MTDSSMEDAGDLPPGVAPSFGVVPVTPFEHVPERIVLSSEAHSRLTPSGALAMLSGPFSADRFGKGYLSIRSTELEGEVHVHADVSRAGGPAIHLDAHVRESWLTRAALEADGASPPVRVVRELIRLAEIPRQSTVTVQVDARS